MVLLSVYFCDPPPRSEKCFFLSPSFELGPVFVERLVVDVPIVFAVRPGFVVFDKLTYVKTMRL